MIAGNLPFRNMFSSMSSWLKGWSWKTALESAFIAAVMSAIVSGVVVVWGSARIETSKEYISSISRQQSQLDSAQSTMFAQLGLYTQKLFDKPEAASLDQLQTSIIATQLQINRLMNELPESQRGILHDYSRELDALSKSLRNVKSKQDLGPVFASAQKLLELHDQVGETVRENMTVSVFRPRRS